LITQVTIENFKKIENEVFDLTDFDLIVGSNNSGKSTLLQALAIWQFAVDSFKTQNRAGGTGVQIVLPNFTALSVPEFNLLWHNKVDRSYPLNNGKKKQEFVLIKIGVSWRNESHEIKNFTVNLRYQSSQTVYAIPAEGWAHFKELQQDPTFPKIAYVPPFSGLEPTEKWLDDGPIKQQVGKGQPGGILRNLLLRVSMKDDEDKKKGSSKNHWNELAGYIKLWFGVELNKPAYRPGTDVNIVVQYMQAGKHFDIISGGSGFHQVLTLLAFLFGYSPTTIMMDEPDAHLHVRLQRDIVEVFRKLARDRGIQFLTATHAEEFMRGVDPTQIISIMQGKPKRVISVPNVVKAMSDVSNDESVRVRSSPFVLYVEGETDERVIRAWAKTLSKDSMLSTYFIKAMLGGSKDLMKSETKKHFEALKEIVPEAKRHILFDRDEEDTAIRPSADNIGISEWTRRNIENYLISPDAWLRASAIKLGCAQSDLFFVPVQKLIIDFFQSENLTLPPNSAWVYLNANIFQNVNGKKLLFENSDSLFQKINTNFNITIPREDVAAAMLKDEIHQDVLGLFAKMEVLSGENNAGGTA
jgi:energy-coupling factor transporter ATP-binding protein EcfA2